MSKSSTMFGYLGQNPTLPLYERLTIQDVLSHGVAKQFAHLFWPDGNPIVCDMVLSYSKQLSMLEKTIRRMVMEILGVEKYIEEQNESSNYVLIFNKYRKPTRDESGIGLAPHTDKNILTILFQIQVNGLQIQKDNGQWVDVEFSPNSFIVLVGDVFKAWTNGRLHAPIHRVLMSRKDEERFSIGFFTFPKEGYLVNVPKELVDEDHPLLYKPFDVSSPFRKRKWGQTRAAATVLFGRDGSKRHNDWIGLTRLDWNRWNLSSFADVHARKKKRGYWGGLCRPRVVGASVLRRI
ncbi:probable 2-oxoglutarate-dependent dioxygenase AOP1 [Solanum verrucosum]|uniref:probable 2-oxoglutarate-dependent dioxygenase AOP1 n=1 Tax=Solanum verrucosum TaxID=315347 RepID=UPI0020D04FB7|nr:probable 2-oxoglutarate-dependent dioxygenase AOP1 [Solanum verrucosum]